jgi:hypothetical protein
MRTFPHGNVIVNTLNLHALDWDQMYTMRTLGDLHLTIYILCSKFKEIHGTHSNTRSRAQFKHYMELLD